MALALVLLGPPDVLLLPSSWPPVMLGVCLLRGLSVSGCRPPRPDIRRGLALTAAFLLTVLPSAWRERRRVPRHPA